MGNNKRAIILAGGKGTRLKPYTISLPKPLVPVGEYPILEIIIRQLAKHGFSHITITINHMADIIKAFFNDGSKWGVRIDYSIENKPLGTMGPLTIINDLPDNFLVMNGDVLTDLNYDDFYRFHVQNGNLFTISSFQREVQSEFGILEINESDRLTGFYEKPVMRSHVSMGIYMVRKDALSKIPKNEFYGFDRLMLDLLADEAPVSVKPHGGYWLDIGRPSDYETALEEINKLDFIG